MRTKVYKGTKMYQIEFIKEDFTIPGFELHPWMLTKGTKYWAYKMKLSGQIVVVGKYTQEFTEKVAEKRIEFTPGFCKRHFKYI